MSTHKPPWNLLDAIKTIPQQIIGYISSAAIRIFSPNDDNYPATGTQPFEGEPDDETLL
ncbi:MAG: hypothetical protein HC881_08205 [Leptolyngbyaceae cyanobacterium SL_7_1]|nr:hypothetical protein [Leptolyngbyaceae cyanobacterium SL_7_1]